MLMQWAIDVIASPSILMYYSLLVLFDRILQGVFCWVMLWVPATHTTPWLKPQGKGFFFFFRDLERLWTGKLPKHLSRKMDFSYCFQILLHSDRENCQNIILFFIFLHTGAPPTPPHLSPLSSTISALFPPVSQWPEKNVCPDDISQP